jgi:hypothetical protein
MTLAAQQHAFHAAIVRDDDTAQGAPNQPGVAVYRNAYRARLMEVLRDSYDKTWTWIGDDAFAAVACHHLILHPPASWTLDDAGKGFDRTVAELLADHPEAADLAWLERAMQDAFCCADTPVLDPHAFAERTAGFGDAGWADMPVRLVAGLQMREVMTDCVALWNAIDSGEAVTAWQFAQPRTVLVWRHGFTPRCRLATNPEVAILAQVRTGARFGDVCETLVSRMGEVKGVAAAGTLLGQWLADGLLADDPDKPIAI